MLRHALFYLVISFHNLGLKLDIASVPKFTVCMFRLAKCIPLLKLYLPFSWKLKTSFIIIVERPFVVCQRRKGGWCASMGGVGGVLKWQAMVILEEIPGWWARQYRGWRIISQIFSKISQEVNIVQSWRKNSGFPSYIHFEHILFFRVSPECLI